MKHHYYRLGLLLALWPLVQLAFGQGLALRGYNPFPNARSAPQTTNVSLLFNQSLSNTAATLNGLRVFSAQRGGLLRNGQGGSTSVSGSTLSFNPATNFKPGETVFVTSTTAIQGTGGARLNRGQVHQFTTGVGGSGRGNFTPPANNPNPGVGRQPRSVSVGDVDGDGDLDLLTANALSDNVSVRLNDGSGNFTPHPTNPEVLVGEFPVSVVLGDMDGDGDLDLLCPNLRDNVSVRLNDGLGNFTPHPINPEPGVGDRPGDRTGSVALGDVDGDGDLDLLCTSFDGDTVSVRLNDGSGNFTAPPINPEVLVGDLPVSVALGDMDGDGDLDLVTVNIGSNTMSVRLNDGSGNFTPHPTNPEPGLGDTPQSVVLGDVDGDGDLDLLTANFDGDTVSVRLNDGSGNFTAPPTNPEPGVGDAPLSMALGDVDGDGDLDFVTANLNDNTVSVRLNNGSGNFTAPPINPEPGVEVIPISVALGDVDGDGDLDLLCTSQNNNTVSVRLNRPLPPTLTGLSASPIPVCGGQPFSVTASVGNLSGSYSYTLSGGSSPISGTATTPTFSQPLTGAGSGVQSFTLSVSSEGQVATATTSVTVNAAPTASLVSSGPLSCAVTSVTLTASGGNSYTFTNGSGTVLGTSGATTTRSVTTAGTYSVRVANASGCVSTTSTTVTSTTATLTITNPTITTATQGTAFSQTFTVTGGITPRSFSLASGSLPTGLSLSTTGVLSGTPTQSGSFPLTLRATDANGCFALSNTYTLVVDSSVPTITGFTPLDNTRCVGSPTTFTASVGNVTGSYSYTLTNGGSTTLGTADNTTFRQELIASGTGPQTFTLTVSSAGQFASATTSLTVNPLPVAALTASPSTVLSCAQASLTLTAGGGTSYVFNGPGIVSQDGNQAVVNAPGSYSVSVTSAGCTSTTSIAISQDNTAPAASLVSSGGLSCRATSVTLTASPNGQVYRFSAGATPIGTTNQASVTTAGIYSVTVSSGNGCSSVASTTVTGDQTPPTVSINPTSGTLTCASPTVTLTANTTAPSLRWSSGQTTPSITVNASGTYSVSAIGANGCSATSNPVLIEASQNAPSATLVASGELSCAVTSVTLTANAGSGLSYRFSEGATPVGSGNTATVNVAGTYSVNVTNTATGCNNTASVAVNQDNSQPTVSITPTSATLNCAVPNVVLTANTSVSSLTWSTGQTTPSISVSVAGTYSVTVTSSNGCRAMAQATVNGTTNAPTAPTLTASPSTSTTNQPITVTASGCTGGMINWTALGGSGQANGNTYILSQQGNYTLSATCSLNGCTSSASAPLAVQIRPGGFAITGVNMVNCQMIDEAKGGYQVQFTPQYAGQNTGPISFAVVNELASTAAPAPYSLRLYTDNPVITLVATQAGSSEARFAYNWLASCQSGTSPNQPPTTTGIPAQTILVGQGYQLPLTSYFSDPDGQALSFQASGLPAGLTLNGSVISGAPSQTGVSTVNITALDPGGLQVSTSFQLTVAPMPVTPPTGFAIVNVATISCQVLSAGQRRLTFTPQYAGVSGAPISFSVVNELVATTSPGPYSLNLYTDNPTITFSAQQGATMSTYRYNWLAVCTPAARVGSGEASSRLQIRVLGNPVEGNSAEVEISGVSGQPVQLNLVDLQGKPVHTQRIEQAAAVERVSLPLGASSGLLLLQVSTPTQRQQVKLLRTN